VLAKREQQASDRGRGLGQLLDILFYAPPCPISSRWFLKQCRRNSPIRGSGLLPVNDFLCQRMRRRPARPMPARTLLFLAVREREKPVSLRGSLYLTLFGNARAKTIPLQGAPVNALDGVQCYLGAFDQFFCRSAFRWPAKLVYAEFGTDISPLTQSVSYSPFPATLRLDPIETHWAPSLPHSAHEVTVVVKEPLAHIRRDFELRGVRVTASANAK
jgi:hypothetical protein